MKRITLFAAVGAFFAFAPIPAHAASELIYRVSGVTDDGSGHFAGVATVIHCTNFGAAVARVNIQYKLPDGSPRSGSVNNLEPGATFSVATHGVNLFNAAGASGVIEQGSAIVSAASRKVHCSAMIIDAAATVPQGIALHMVRYNPAPESEE